MKKTVQNVIRVGVGVCQGRHEMPITEYVFENIPDPMDFEGMEKTAKEFLFQKAYPINTKKYIACADADVRDWYAGQLDLYVTGLTSAVFAIVNAALSLGYEITLWHFNKETGEYLPQQVWSKFC